MISHRERLQACLRGERTDRVPVALWRHFPVDDQDPEALSRAQTAFQRTYDFDLVKVTPASSFCVKDWGVEDVWEGHPEGTRRSTRTVISEPKDWEQLPVLDPALGKLKSQLACLRQLRQSLGAETPLLQTIFSPLAQAKHLAGEGLLLAHLRLFPDALARGLQIISASTKVFIEAAIEAGIDGIFYAVQHAQPALLSRDEYARFGCPPDLDVLTSIRGLWCNMLHLHGEGVYFDAFSNYPVQIINWHDRETLPSLAQARRVFAGAVCGGLSLDTLTYRTSADVRREAAETMAAANGRRFILGTGCVVPIIAPYGNLMAARRAASEDPRQRADTGA